MFIFRMYVLAKVYLLYLAHRGQGDMHQKWKSTDQINKCILLSIKPHLHEFFDQTSVMCIIYSRRKARSKEATSITVRGMEVDIEVRAVPRTNRCQLTGPFL